MTDKMRGEPNLLRSPTFYGLLAGGLLVRLLCLAKIPFYADVPESVRAVDSGTMHIQFPGYVPFHLLVAAFAPLFSSTFAAMVLLSLLCGLGAVVYIGLTAECLAGRTNGILATALSAFGLIGTYFSVVGSSYTTDMLAVAAVSYHGIRSLQDKTPSHHLLFAVAAGCFGLLMRPLSGIWMFPGLAYLVWRRADRAAFRNALLLVTLTVLLGMAVSAWFFHSWAEFVDSTVGPRTIAGESMNRNQLVTASVRLLGFPLYFFNAWLALSAVSVWQAIRRGTNPSERKAAGFLLMLGLPYSIVLLRHIPQAGYLCYLAPLLIVCPFIFQDLPEARFYPIVASFCVVVGLIQLLVLRPVTPNSTFTLVADAYFLQYSNAGISRGMCETLSSLSFKTGRLQEQIPAARREELLKRSAPPASGTKP